MGQTLIIFTRYPEPGRAKTRLIPALGAAGAAALHRQMTEHTIAQVRQLQQAYPVAVTVQFTGGDRAQMAAWLGSDWAYQRQMGDDLGDRMMQASQTAFVAGAEAIVIIGTDCPDLDAILLETAFRAVPHHDLVLGAASDGGYYLIGFPRLIPALFQQMPWSTAAVLPKTLAVAQQLQLTTQMLPVLTDIDYPADLPVWEKAKLRYSGANDVLGVGNS